MSYQALYRKFRPAAFQDVKGQEHIVTTLQNQIKADRIGHAYLFCGTRGTGKTTIAKIFAKAVNCEHPIDGNPCGECRMCRAIAAGASMNVIEIDAASNNGVDNIREIVDEVSFSPAEGKYKVYIIDEVHMLSMGAFNALLKTLEEPPSYVIFILATTEAHKIPITILSRCQRYDFKRISIDVITERLKELMIKEKVSSQEKALRYIAKMGDGSMRDSLSLLDQCIAFHYGEELTYDMVLEVLGAVDSEVFGRMLRFIVEQDVLACIGLLEEVMMQGRELTQFVTDFSWYLRNILLLQSSDGIEDVIEVSTDNLTQMREEAALTDSAAIMRYLRIFSELSGKLKFATAKRILIEMTIIKICRPEMETNTDALNARVRDLEKKVEKGIIVDSERKNQQDDTVITVKKEKPVLAQALPEDVQKAVNGWGMIVQNAGQPMKTYLSGARLSIDKENRLLIVLEDGPASDYFSRHVDNKEAFDEILGKAIGKKIETEIRALSKDDEFDSSYVDLSEINFNIEEE